MYRGTQFLVSGLEPPTPVHRIPLDSSSEHSLIQHLEELRHRLWICVASIAILASCAFIWSERLVGMLKAPAGASLPVLAFFSPAEGLIAYCQVAIAFGVAGSMPVLLAQVWGFVRPGLNPREHRFGRLFIVWGSVLFMIGALFAYGVILPVTLRFLLTFGGPHLIPVISIGRYIGFTVMVLLSTGMVFELPLVIYVLARVGVVNAQQLRRHWRGAYVGILITAAIVTPTPDAITMLVLAVPLFGLYECSIWIARWAAPAETTGPR